jgi:mono/diheme cytochrome c family protein
MRTVTAFGLAALLLGGAIFMLTESEAKADPATAAKGDAVKGNQVYTLYCLPCHGEKGDGKGPVGITLQPPPRDFIKGEFKYASTDQELFEVITGGAAARGGSPLMTPWNGILSEEDRWNVLRFIRSLKGKTASAQ